MSPRRGASALEFALALPVLLVLMAGVIEYGWWFYKEVGVVQIARDAALAGSLVATSSDPAGTAQTRAHAALSEAGYDQAHATVGTGAVATASGVALQVSVTVPYHHLLVLVPAPGTLRARSAFRLLDQP